jgi:hypothetical protein
LNSDGPAGNAAAPDDELEELAYLTDMMARWKWVFLAAFDGRYLAVLSASF